LNARGVIIETTASFKVTWDVVGTPKTVKWNQNNQYIEIHDADVYPDLNFYEATGRATYVKYVSAARINELLTAISRKVEDLIKLGHVDENETGSLQAGGNMETQPQQTEQPGVTQGEEQKRELGDYTVTIHAPNLKFIEGQRNTTTANAEHLFKVSNNLQETLGAGGFNNKEKIYAEVSYKMNGRSFSKRLEYNQFEETETKFGGNLLVQALPSIEVKMKAKEDVYAYDDDDSTEVKVTKAVRADLEKLPEEKLSEIENMILRIRQSRTAKKAQDAQDKQTDSNK